MRVVIIGAGIGGLVAALLLAQAGAAVTVLEAAAKPGGKLHQLPVGDGFIDAGPTVFTMRPVFEAIFAAAGARLADSLRLEPLEILARHRWAGGAALDLFADPARNRDAIGGFAGAAAARLYADFAGRAKKIYELLDASFMQVAQPGLFGLLKHAGPGLTAISPFVSLWDELGKYFPDPRLRQLFGRYATYCGSSPFEAPATLMLIAHAEALGVWRVEGGVYRLAVALEALAAARGAVFHYGVRATGLEVAGGRARGVRSTSERFPADAVIANTELAALDSGLLGAEAAKAVAGLSRGARRSFSAVTWAMAGEMAGHELAHHNVFFSDDYAAEFRELAAGEVPRRPTVYVCAPSPGKLFCLINAPANGQAAGEDALAAMQATLARGGARLAPGEALRTDPAGWAAKFPGNGGALYGRALTGWRDSFARPGAATKLPGFYLAGGAVHPGPGLPMAALSGRIAANHVLTHKARDAV